MPLLKLECKCQLVMQGGVLQAHIMQGVGQAKQPLICTSDIDSTNDRPFSMLSSAAICRIVTWQVQIAECLIAGGVERLMSPREVGGQC